MSGANITKKCAVCQSELSVSLDPATPEIIAEYRADNVCKGCGGALTITVIEHDT